MKVFNHHESFDLVCAFFSFVQVLVAPVAVVTVLPVLHSVVENDQRRELLLAGIAPLSAQLLLVDVDRVLA